MYFIPNHKDSEDTRRMYKISLIPFYIGIALYIKYYYVLHYNKIYNIFILV